MKNRNDNLYAQIEARFPADRNRTFIESENGHTLSYAVLEDRAGRMAAAMDSLGLTPGDRVAVQVAKSPDSVFLYLACLKGGFIYLPLNTAYARGELMYFIGNATPALIVCDPAREAEIRALAPQGTHILTLDQSGGGSLAEAAWQARARSGIEPVAPDDTAALVYTSGTTGQPKGAMLTHRNLAFHARTLHRLWGFESGDVLLHALPIYHTHGLFIAINCVLWNGTGMIFLPRFDARKVIECMPRATVMMGVPTFYTRLLDEPDFGPDACGAMRLFISGSAPLLESTFADFQARTGHTLLERYGMTEAGIITTNPLDGERVATTVGFALPGVDIRIAREDGSPVEPGETGVLEVRGEDLFAGYWGAPEKTQAEFRDGYFSTGDFARTDADGRVTITCRAKDLIISGGLNVYPREVEREIDALDGVDECAVIGLPHRDLGEAVTAIVRRRADAPEIGPADILAGLEGRLAPFKHPKQILFIANLPRNAMGKVLKYQLREQFRGEYSG